jgi:hypothetical protein
LTAGRHRKFEKIILRLGTHHYPDEQSPTPQEDDNEIQDDEDDKNVESQGRVRALLELANLNEEFVSEHSILCGVALGVFFRHINRLKIALSKHLKDLEGRILTATKIEVDLGERPIDDEDDELIGGDVSEDSSTFF